MNPWVAPADLPDMPDLGAEVDLDLVCAAASHILYVLSGRQFVIDGSSTIRPVRLWRDCGCLPWWASAWGEWGSAWSSYPFLRFFPDGVTGCGCPSAREVVLPGSQVQAISQVKVDGAVLSSSNYALFEKRRLVRTDSNAWPCCQQLSDPDSATGTWSITYTWGKPPDEAGILACRALAKEIALAMADKPSALPARVTSVARQGVNAVVADPLSFIEKGLTGLPIVDLWIMAVNPYGQRRRARVYSPDLMDFPRATPLT